MRVLCIHSSANPDSRSRAMLSHFLGCLQQREPATEVEELDLVASPPPAFDAEHFEVYKEQTPEAQARVAHELALKRDPRAGPEARIDEAALKYIKQCQWADCILISLPIYNWGIPAQLKAWVDQVSRIGYTFKTIPTGIEGLLNHAPSDWDAPTPYNTQKKVIVFVSSGMTPASKVTGYLRDLFAFFGVHDVQEVGCACLDQTIVPKAAFEEVTALFEKTFG